MKTFKVVGVVVGTIVLLLTLWTGFTAFRYYTAEVRGVVGAEEQIESAPSRISRYEYFFDLCAQVQTSEARLKAQKQRLETAEDADSREKSRIRSAIAGIEAQRASNINQYNAQSTKEYTAARFKASNLPYRLDMSNYSTRCTN